MAIYGLIRQVLLKVTPLIVQQHQDLSLRISQMLDEILPKKSGIALPLVQNQDDAILLGG